MSAVAASRRGDFTANPRVLVVTLMAMMIGVAGAFVALALTKLISVFTNLFYYLRLSTVDASPAGHHLGVWSVLIPIIGGLIIGLMARYGSEKIRGHGIPEALEEASGDCAPRRAATPVPTAAELWAAHSAM